MTEFGFRRLKKNSESSMRNDVMIPAGPDFLPMKPHIKALLGLPRQGGLEALKRALQLRLYARINKQEIVEEKSDSFVFRMIDCRVQSSRRLKGLEDYPCKSIGIIEYRTFAGTIDSRIQTECLGCPPDPPQPGWYCSWRFSLL
jgi:hypothetical protein